MTIEKPPNGAGRHMQPMLLQQIDQFDQCDVDLELDGAEDHVPICFNAVGALIPALWLRSCGPRGFECPHPSNSRRNTDAEPISSRTSR
jgi:hypothetical protein